MMLRIDQLCLLIGTDLGGVIDLPLLKVITCCVEAINAANAVLWQTDKQTNKQTNRQTDRLLYPWPPTRASGN